MSGENEKTSSESGRTPGEKAETPVRMTRKIDLRMVNCPEVPLGKLHGAIGMLAWWGLAIFTTCLIANDEGGNIDATYFRENGDVGYTICAVWRKQADGQMGYDFNS